MSWPSTPREYLDHLEMLRLISVMQRTLTSDTHVLSEDERTALESALEKAHAELRERLCSETIP